MATKAPSAPTSLRPDPNVLKRIKRIAKANGLSVSTALNLCLAGGMSIVETKLQEIRNATEQPTTKP